MIEPMTQNTDPKMAHAARSVDRLKGWLLQSALPLWIDRGFDAQVGGFHERLDFDAKPILAVPRRLTVQARQIFVYARAITFGWMPYDVRLATAFESMVARYYRADGQPGFIFAVDTSGAILDRSRDLYAHAFVLLAIAGYYRLTGDVGAIHLADETLAFLDAAMTAPNGGYVDAMPNPPTRLRQNPHMHLFESLLALFEATGKTVYLVRADAIFGYFKTWFFQPASGTVAEYFDLDWQPVDGALAMWEPGHHMEWAWLLSEYQSLSRTKTIDIADRLIYVAYRHGVSPPAFIIDEVRGDGLALKKSCRSWPLTEAIKAQSVRLSSDVLAADRLTAAADFLYDRHLAGLVPGLWRDHLSEKGECLPAYVPASTLYHIAMSVFIADVALGLS